jgi:iron complex outermembrane recepter protein
VISLALAAAQASAAEQDLTDLDLATLMSMDVTVTAASRRAQSSSDAAAAVYVITREEIERSGATSLPEALRLAPGIEVARINTRGWAVTTRGFNHRFANKLLVMIDGRSIYTPLFSGVFWDEQWVPLEQIDRIEVVRGPGGALWGINAVNGVINIITRKASDQAGLSVSAGSGSLETMSAGVTYGGRSDSVGDYSVHVNRSEEDELQSRDEPITHTQLGLRIDHPLQRGSLSLQSDFTHSDFGDAPAWPELSLGEDADVGNVSVNWQQEVTSGSLEIQSYYSWSERGAPVTWDDSALGLDVQFSAKRIGRHLMTAGAGYVQKQDKLYDNDEYGFHITPASLEQHQWSVYGQDEIHFRDDALRLILGVKLEDLRFSGMSFQPTLRGLWQVTSTHTLWAAASRAERTPSRAELHGDLQLGGYRNQMPVLLRIQGDPNLKAEDLHAYELGWRWRPYQSLSFDVAAYRNDYEHIVGQEIRGTSIDFGPPPALVLSTAIVSASDAQVNGLELSTEWAPASWLHLEAGAAFQDNQAHANEVTPGGVDPKRMFSLRAQTDLPHDLRFDLGWRSVSALEGLGVDAYDSVNTRIAWRPLEDIELSVAVDNLFDNEHVEFSDDLRLLSGAEIGRSFFARVTWQPRR